MRMMHYPGKPYVCKETLRAPATAALTASYRSAQCQAQRSMPGAALTARRQLLQRFIDQSLQRFIDQSLQRFIDQSLQCFIDQSLQRFIDRSLQRFIDPSLQRFLDQSLQRFIDRAD